LHVFQRDSEAHIPDIARVRECKTQFRAAERCLQLLTQVSGRAGRGLAPGRVIVQAFRPEAVSLEYDAFAQDELRRREALRFPPPDAPEPPGLAVLDAVRVFRVRCFDGGTWRTEWTSPRLPRAVEVTLGVADGAELVTRIALPTQGDT